MDCSPVDFIDDLDAKLARLERENKMMAHRIERDSRLLTDYWETDRILTAEVARLVKENMELRKQLNQTESK